MGKPYFGMKRVVALVGMMPFILGKMAMKLSLTYPALVD